MGKNQSGTKPKHTPTGNTGTKGAQAEGGGIPTGNTGTRAPMEYHATMKFTATKGIPTGNTDTKGSADSANKK